MRANIVEPFPLDIVGYLFMIITVKIKGDSGRIFH